MNKHFFSKLYFAVALIGAVGVFSSDSISASCYDHDNAGECRANGCVWHDIKPTCSGSNKACASINNLSTCMQTKGCHWGTGIQCVDESGL